jgi:putative ABC transport system permease protein
MKYFELIWAALFRRKIRTVLTLLSILVAFLLFGPLETVRSTFANFGQSAAGHDRLITMSKIQPGAPLPQSLYARIQEVPGIVNIDFSSFSQGTYQDPKNVIAVETHTRAFFDLYPELEVAPSERVALHSTRTGAIAGEALARKFKWKVGDKIPLQTSLPRKDGSNTWTFDLVGIYRFTDPGMKVWENMLYINWDYFDAARLDATGTVAWYVLKVANPAQLDGIAQAVDAISANSAHETKTQSENAFSAAWIGQVGDLGLIVTSIMGAVFFTLLLLTGHTMAQAVSERSREVAILKTLGFTGRRVMGLVLGESVLLLLLGSAAGLAIATAAVAGARSMLLDSLPIPLLPIGGTVWLRGLAVAFAIGLVVGAVPALRTLRLRIVDALADR